MLPGRTIPLPGPLCAPLGRCRLSAAATPRSQPRKLPPQPKPPRISPATRAPSMIALPDLACWHRWSSTRVSPTVRRHRSSVCVVPCSQCTRSQPATHLSVWAGLGGGFRETPTLPNAAHTGLPNCAGYGAYPPWSYGSHATSNAGLKGWARVSSTLGGRGRPSRAAPLATSWGLDPVRR